jgi:hypothetical protein
LPFKSSHFKSTAGISAAQASLPPEAAAWSSAIMDAPAGKSSAGLAAARAGSNELESAKTATSAPKTKARPARPILYAGMCIHTPST